MKSMIVSRYCRKMGMRKFSFALVELMLTAAVLAIIAVLVIPFFSRANQKGRYTTWVNQKNRILSDGDLRVYYDFADGEGSIVRNSARGFHQQDYDPIVNDARIVKGATWSNGRWQMKPSLEFDGSSGYMSANADITNKSATYILWVKLQEASGGLMMTAKTRKKDSPSMLKINIQKGFVRAAIKRKAVISKEACKLSQWHMVAVTVGEKNNSLKLFLDGKSQGEVNNVPLKGLEQNSFLLAYCSGSGYFKGRIGEFMAFSRELSAEEVQKIYQETHP